MQVAARPTKYGPDASTVVPITAQQTAISNCNTQIELLTGGWPCLRGAKFGREQPAQANTRTDLQHRHATHQAGSLHQLPVRQPCVQCRIMSKDCDQTPSALIRVVKSAAHSILRWGAEQGNPVHVALSQCMLMDRAMPSRSAA